jgi:16S rRNA (cytosine1402-N4)-methyltransferase
MIEMEHIPVLLNETISVIRPCDGCRFVDATFGGGGHAMAILESCDCYVCGIDRDPDSAERAERVSSKYPGKFEFMLGRFANLRDLLHGYSKFDGILFDFGISSFQVDDPDRGFSFSKTGILDMRMGKSGISAREVVNEFSEGDIAKILRVYGDETRAKRIAGEIVKTRKKNAIDTTTQLRDIVLSVYPSQSILKKYSKLDAATKTFQALRIFVNDELSEIDAALRQSHEILNAGGRIVTIAFHSLEDRIVKNWARDNAGCITPMCFGEASGKGRQYIRPSEEEILSNPRSRSAILRGFIYNNGDDKDAHGDGC